jgi:hypothetical protein
MTQPKQVLPKRRRQILDDETEASQRLHASEDQGTQVHEDDWIANFMTRLNGVVRKLGGKS